MKTKNLLMSLFLAIATLTLILTTKPAHADGTRGGGDVFDGGGTVKTWDELERGQPFNPTRQPAYPQIREQLARIHKVLPKLADFMTTQFEGGAGLAWYFVTPPLADVKDEGRSMLTLSYKKVQAAVLIGREVFVYEKTWHELSHLGPEPQAFLLMHEMVRFWLKDLINRHAGEEIRRITGILMNPYIETLTRQAAIDLISDATTDNRCGIFTGCDESSSQKWTPENFSDALFSNPSQEFVVDGDLYYPSNKGASCQFVYSYGATDNLIGIAIVNITSDFTEPVKVVYRFFNGFYHRVDFLEGYEDLLKMLFLAPEMAKYYKPSDRESGEYITRDIETEYFDASYSDALILKVLSNLRSFNKEYMLNAMKFLVDQKACPQSKYDELWEAFSQSRAKPITSSTATTRLEIVD